LRHWLQHELSFLKALKHTRKEVTLSSRLRSSRPKFWHCAKTGRNLGITRDSLGTIRPSILPWLCTGRRLS